MTEAFIIDTVRTPVGRYGGALSRVRPDDLAAGFERIEHEPNLLDDLAGVTVDGKPVRPAAATRLFRFYKPQRTLTAANDPKNRPTIYDRLPPGLPRVIPVGFWNVGITYRKAGAPGPPFRYL